MLSCEIYPFTFALGLGLAPVQFPCLDHFVATKAWYIRPGLLWIIMRSHHKQSFLHYADQQVQDVKTTVSDCMAVSSLSLSGGFTPSRHLTPSSGREHTIV